MSRKMLGIIGGMGPEATDLFYRRLIERTDAQCDQEHIDMVILSHATMPDRTTAIVTKDDKELIKTICNDAKTLESLGVSNIAITCNTSHYFYDYIQKSVNMEDLKK